MATYANQRTLTIEKPKYTENFLQVGISELEAAASTLTGGGLKLYLYLASNKNGYTWDLSSADFEEKYGVSNKTYRNAFKELESWGYIKKVEGRKNMYVFNTSM